MKSKFINFIVIIGIIVFLIGVYSMFFGAGVPYTDPTPEMARKWTFYYNLGKLTIPTGAVLIVTGIAVKIFTKIYKG